MQVRNICVKRLLAVFAILFSIAIFGCGPSSPSSESLGELPDSQRATETVSQSEPLADNHYVDDQICAECHSEIFDSYQSVGMAKSFYDFDPTDTIEDFESGFYHEASDRYYEMSVESGRLLMKRFRKRDDGPRIHEHQQFADYVVGSGKHVRTYLSREASGEMYQLPVVWYAQDKKWGMAPGYDRADHDGFNRRIRRQCMFCHNAYPDHEPATDCFGTVDVFPKKLPQGIGCQRCHGPGEQHVDLANAEAELGRVNASIVNPANLSAQLQDDVCNQCHFQPTSGRTSFVRNPGKADYSFQPGQPLGQYMKHLDLVHGGNSEPADTFEINHHPYRLYQSACYVSSGGAIRCTTCHDPHAVVPDSQKAAHYRAKCFSCHGKSDCGDEQGKLPSADCTSCHMPERRTEDVVHVTMTDHKITRRPSLDDPTGALVEFDISSSEEMKPYQWLRSKIAPDTTSSASDNVANEAASKTEELALAIARLQDRDLRAVEVLEKLVSELQGTSEIEPKLQLAQTYLELGRYRETVDVLSPFEDRENLTSFVHTNLGVAFHGLGQSEKSVEHLLMATEAGPARPEAFYNLAIVYRSLNRPADEISILRQCVELRPNYSKAHYRLGNAFALADQTKKAEIHFRKVLEIDPDYGLAYQKLAVLARLDKEWGKAIQIAKEGINSLSQEPKIERELCLLLVSASDQDLVDYPGSLRSARRLVDLVGLPGSGSTDFQKSEAELVLCLSLALNELADESLQRLYKLGNVPQLRPEAALISAMAQQQLGRDGPAQSNFENAMAFLQGKPMNRLRRIVVDLAQAKFK